VSIQPQETALCPPAPPRNGQYVRVWVYLTDQDSALVPAATTRNITITGLGGTPTTETGALIDYFATYGINSGWYYYDAVTSYNDKNIDVAVSFGKSKFTAAQCKDTGIEKGLTTWEIKDCY